MLTKNNKRGFILIASYMVIVVLLILAIAFISRSVSESNLARRKKQSIQALYLAEAGIDYALSQLRDGNLQGDPVATNLSGIGTYDCNWDLKPGFTNRWLLVSRGVTGDTVREIHVDAQPDTFARYFYFTDDEHFRWWWWRIPVWFVTGDYLGGPLQINSHLHISGDPVFADPEFENPVKTADDFIEYRNGGPPNDNPDFQNGIALGLDAVDLPPGAPVLEAAASSGGYYFSASSSDPARISLNSDGTMTVTDLNRNNENMPLPANGAVFVTGGNVEISGTLSGQLSVGAEENIIITDNIIYNNDPRVNPDSTDTLGLISERDIVISENAPFDVQLDASMIALGNSFTVEEWWDAPAKGALNVYGGIIQDERGPVGTFNSRTNTKVSGYSKNYQYDSRLMENPPPFYPNTGDYVILSWQEQ